LAWVTPPTFTSGAVLTAAQLTILGNNLLETLPAKVTAAGQIGVGTAANAIAARTCPSNVVSTSEAVNVTSYANISGGTLGPTVTVTTGTFAFVFLGCNMFNNTGGAASYMSYAVTGATADAADDTRALYYESSNANDLIGFGNICFHTLVAGSNTFQAKYRVGAGTATFGSRRLAVMNFGQ
jgi:hypothetical protein